MTVPKELYRAVLQRHLDRYEFHYFVTLATNFSSHGVNSMWALLKKWDARVNRRIVGPKWHKRTDERMVWFAFLEKSDVNPHWHLLVSLDHDHLGDSNRRKRTDAFPKVADQVWQDLLARGSVDVQEVKDTGVNRYVTKSLDPKLARHHVIYSEFFSIN